MNSAANITLHGEAQIIENGYVSTIVLIPKNGLPSPLTIFSHRCVSRYQIVPGVYVVIRLLVSDRCRWKDRWKDKDIKMEFLNGIYMPLYVLCVLNSMKCI